VHKVAAGAEEYVPAGHAAQEDAERVDEYVPDIHTVQADAPVCAAYRPALHCRHTLAVPSAYEPSEQFWHTKLVSS
jgi:hypothetical protein